MRRNGKVQKRSVRPLSVVVTGGTSGIGLATAIKFNAEGHNVTVVGRNFRRVPDNITRHVRFDFNDGHDALVRQDLDFRLKRIDVLVISAGLYWKDRYGSNRLYADGAHWEKMINVNLLGAIESVNAAVPFMKKGGRIVFVGSVAATKGMKHETVYAATKWGLRGYFESLRLLLYNSGIRCSMINPGGTDTELWEKEMYDGDRGKLLPASGLADCIYKIATTNAEIKDITVLPLNEQH